MPDISEITKRFIKPEEETDANKSHNTDFNDLIQTKPKGKIPDFSFFFSEESIFDLDDIDAKPNKADMYYMPPKSPPDPAEITARNYRILADMAPYTLKEKEFDFCRVSDAIGSDFELWNKSDPVFIDAPTGTGKTTFVYEKLIPEAISKEYGVLIVSNRIALSMQQKMKIYEIIKIIAPRTLNGLKKEDIDKDTIMIGPVCVTTYQGLYKLFNPDVFLANNFDFHTPEELEAERIKNWSRRLRYAIFDEIHFLYSDAEFNDYCGLLTNYISYVFRDVIRVYMTATSWEIIDYIRKYETNIYRRNEQNPPQAPYMDQNVIRSFNSKAANSMSFPQISREFCYYKINADYSKYKLRFFSVKRKSNNSKTDGTKSETTKKTNAVLNIMKSSEPSESNKWIVFVDNKNDGLNLYYSLSKNFSVAYIDRMTSLPDDGVKKAIINDEYFKQSVLITTPVIDSGVNICDDNVKNIVIFYTDRTQFIQSLGRKRLKEDESGINVWAFVPNKMSFSAHAKYYEQDALTGIRLLFAVGSRYHYFDSELSKKHILTEYGKSVVTEQVLSEIDQSVRTKLTDEHLQLFNKLAYGPKFRDVNLMYADGMKNGYTSLVKKLNADNIKINTKTLTYINGDGLMTTNIYVLGVILSKREFYKRFTGSSGEEDYRLVVGAWLNRQNIAEEIEAEADEQKQSAMENLAKLLDQNLDQVISDKDFQILKKAVVDAHIIAIPKSDLAKRSKDRKANWSARSLNRLLSDMKLDYVISSKIIKENNDKTRNGSKKTGGIYSWCVSKITSEK